MFEKIGRLAESAATNVSLSRRGFVAQLGKSALGAAGVLAVLLGSASRARAGNHDFYSCTYANKGGKKCNYVYCAGTYYFCGGCPEFGCCNLVSKSVIGAC